MTMAALTPAIWALGQFATVVYEPERRQLNEGQPLPAETRWMLSGPVSDKTELVELRIYDQPDRRRLLHTAQWIRTEWSGERRFLIPVDLKLQGNDSYTFELGFYQPVPEAAVKDLRSDLERYLSAYIDEVFDVGRRRSRLSKPVKQVMEEMGLIVEQGTERYRCRLGNSFPGFSQLVEDKLRKTHGTALSVARFSIKRSEEDSERDRRIAYSRTQMESIKEVVRSEVGAFLDRQLLVLRDRTMIQDQPTEKLKRIVAVNLGYGGIYNSGSLEDLSYGSAPYLGLSLPFGRRTMHSRFASNSSFSAGVFLANTTDELGGEVSGPLVGRPMYAAFGYRLFRMLRVNAGAAILQQAADGNGLDLNKIYMSPFVGLSLEINLWLGLDR